MLALSVVVLPAGCDEEGLAGRRPDIVFGERGLGPGQFVYPRAMTIAPDGRLFIVDKFARIQRFSPTGEFEIGWQMPEWQAGKPTGLTADRHGRVLVADTHYHRVMIFDRDGHELGRFGTFGEEVGQFIYPTAVAEDSQGNLYVAEYGGNDRITRFTSDFQPTMAFGNQQAGEAALSRPQSMLFDEEDKLWVADACHHRICRFNRDGTLLASFGTPGRDAGQLQYPYDIAMRPDGTLLVCEFGNVRVQRFDRQGHSLETWGRPGRNPGELAAPWGVAVGPNQWTYVLDTNNNRVQVIEN